MKGLWKYIPPFAPDQSGACAVLCELGGLIVIIDAGGCAGNVCGFDEPRWFSSKSAIFSAGLRDMDAILGRDEKLVDKTVKACEQIEGKFVALIGTPVPAVIGTDYRALKRMIHKRTGLPVITVESTGTHRYDRGAEQAFTELVKTFVKSDKSDDEKESDKINDKIEEKQFADNKASIAVKEQTENGLAKILYIGATPLDTDGIAKAGWLGMGSGIEALTGHFQSYDRVQVVSPSGIAAARLLKEKTGLEYSVGYPLETLEGYDDFMGFLKVRKLEDRILILQQQILADSIREKMEEVRGNADGIDVCSWFMMDKSYMRENDRILKEEDDWIRLVKEGGYDLIIADPILKKAIPDYKGRFISLPHFALSGRKLTLKGFGLSAMHPDTMYLD